jgi:hypothetical protein
MVERKLLAAGRPAGAGFFYFALRIRDSHLMRTATLFLLATLLVSCSGSGGTRKSDYQYRKVTEVDASAQKIYDRSLSWMAQAFEKSDDAIQLRDEENRKVIANAVVNVQLGIVRRDIDFNLIVEAKDGRFRMTGRNYILISESEYRADRPLAKSQIPTVRARMDSLRKGLASYIEEEEDDDW